MNNQTLDTIFSRSSYRGPFQDTPVPREDLVTILKAGIAAPSGCNRQTACILVFTREIAGVDGHCYHVQDYGAAMENMLLAIKSMGYETCWYEGNVRGCAKEMADFLEVPEEYRLVCLLPVGVPAQELPPRKEKKAFEERAWFNRFGGR